MRRYQLDLNNLTKMLLSTAVAPYSCCSFRFRADHSRLTARGLGLSFSRVTYADIARYIGLDPANMFLDAPIFVLDRARTPTPLFKQIIEDMNLALNQFDPPDQHRTEEARSRFLAPVHPTCYCTSANLLTQTMNRLVAQFHLLIQTTLESIMQGRITTKGRVEYQSKVCGALTILFVEVKLRLGSYDERLNAIAQVVERMAVLPMFYEIQDCQKDRTIAIF